MRTAAARIAKAIQPHCVLLVSSFWLDAAAAPAAAAAAGLTPDVVVAATVVAAGVWVSVCVTVTVVGGTVFVTVGEGVVVVTVTISAWGGGACDVSVGVVEVVGAAVESDGAVGAVRVDARVPFAVPLPPPHDESAKPANAIRIPAVPTLTERVRCQAPLPRLYTPPIVSRVGAP
jgi:hypothetical protein